MIALLDLAIRVSAVLLLALAAAALMTRQSAARRHLVLAAGLAGALLVGPLSWVAPSWGPVTTPPASFQDAIPIEVPAPAAPDEPEDLPSWTWESAVLSAWIGGSALRGLWLTLLLARVWRHTQAGVVVRGLWARQLADVAHGLGIGRAIEIRASPHSHGPAAWGWRSPVILVPEDAPSWDQARVRMVLLHELAHISRRDWPVQILGELATVAYWWHPLVWVVRSRARRDSERACDDIVLQGGIGAAAYGTELVHLARRHARLTHGAPVVGMAHPSSLERRVTAMLNPTLDRRPVTRRAAAACGAVLLVALLPIAAFRPFAQEVPQSFVVQVFDPSGAVLPGVTIVLGDASQGQRSTTTEGSGRAVFDGVAPGEYTISATLPGFRTLNGSFTIRAVRDRQRSITLQVGEITETVSVSARRPRSAAPSAGAVVEPLRVGGNIKVPRKLNHVAPEYPSAMRDAGLEAVVPIEALIGRDGNVVSTRVLSAYVHPEFARAAADAVSRWVFSPTLLNGEAVEVRMNVSVRFALED